jgi:hypothetical protein
MSRWLDPRCQPLPFSWPGPFVVLADDRLLMVRAGAVQTSSEDGATWSEPRPIPGLENSGALDNTGALLLTRAGVLVLVYMGQADFRFGWDAETGEPSPDSRCDVWAIRSLDEGVTWQDHQRLLCGYCGAIENMIETRAGDLVVPVQNMVPCPGRNVQYTYRSTDQGVTWTRSNVLDLGGHGHHDGGFEGTVAELSDGRLLLLLRTNLDRFWEAVSTDGGRYWRELRPSALDASSAPGYLLRLAGGRLALVWNRLNLESGAEGWRRADPQYHETAASWQRDELSLAFSPDDGQSWTEPVVLAREPGSTAQGTYLSYPFVLERRPGELWITTRFNVQPPLCVRVEEGDFA